MDEYGAGKDATCDRPPGWKSGFWLAEFTQRAFGRRVFMLFSLHIPLFLMAVDKVDSL